MAAVRKDSTVFDCISKSRIAAIHILGFNQKHIAYKFFAPAHGEEELNNGEPFVLGKTSAPMLQSVPAYVECRVHHIVDDGGDHAVIIMEVVEAECRRQARPLTVAESPWEYGG